MFSITIYQVAKLFIFMLLGFALTKLKVLPKGSPKILSKLEVNLFLPCLVFTTFYTQCTVDILGKNARLLGISTAYVVVLFVIGTLVGRRLSRDHYVQNVCIYSINVPNTSYVATPLILGLFGQQVLMELMIFTIPISIYTYTEGFRLLLDRKGISLKNFLNPPLIAIFVGAFFGLLKIPVPALATEVIDGCSACMGPVAMILAGSTIAEFAFRDILGDWQIYAVIAIRMLAIPAVVLTVGKLLGLDETAMLLLCGTYSMPTGLNTVIFPSTIGKDCKMGAGMACVSNTLSVLTVPLFFSVFCG